MKKATMIEQIDSSINLLFYGGGDVELSGHEFRMHPYDLAVLSGVQSFGSSEYYKGVAVVSDSEIKRGQFCLKEATNGI